MCNQKGDEKKFHPFFTENSLAENSAWAHALDVERVLIMRPRTVTAALQGIPCH
jgi:hypothetical protein